MIIYGTGSKDLGTRKLQGTRCPNCEANEVYIQAVSRYFDVFWIPIFPFSKKYFSICGNCQQVLKKKEMPQQIKDKLEIEKHHFKTPFYLFAGTGLIALLAIYITYNSMKQDEELLVNLQNLEPKDVIVFDNPEGDYSFAKVIEKSNDTIYMYYGNYTVDKIPGESEVNEKRREFKDFFSEIQVYYTQKEMDSLHKIGAIEDIFKH